MEKLPEEFIEELMIVQQRFIQDQYGQIGLFCEGKKQ